MFCIALSYCMVLHMNYIQTETPVSQFAYVLTGRIEPRKYKAVPVALKSLRKFAISLDVRKEYFLGQINRKSSENAIGQ